MTRTLALLAAASLSFAACSSGTDERDAIFGSNDRSNTTEAELDPVEPPEQDDDEDKSGAGSEEIVPSDLPRVEVIDVASEERIQLASLVPAERPLLVWFWAPH